MKKTLFALLFIPLFSNAQTAKYAQTQNYLHRMHFYGGESTLEDYNGFGSALSSDQCKEFGIQKVTLERGRKSDKLTKTEYDLTSSGRIQRIQKPKETLIYSYEQDSLVSSIVTTGKEVYKTNFAYSTKGYLKKKEVYKGDRLRSRVLLDYGQEDRVLFCLLQSGRKLKTSFAMSYEYEDEKLRRQRFTRNDRVLQVWDYSCEPKGEAIEEKKLSVLCRVREENNDGSYTEHVRKVKDGKVFLYTHKFNKDSLNIASSCEKETGEKMWEWELANNERTYITYSSKGHIVRTHITKYSESGQIVESKAIYGKKQKRVSKTTYSYNEQGLISEQISFYKGKQSYIRKYSYTS